MSIAENRRAPPVLDEDGVDWNEVYREFAARLVDVAEAEIGRKLARLVDAHDVVQSAFRTIIRRARDNRKRLELPPETDLWRLLLVVTLNKIRRAGNFHRAAKRTIERTSSIIDDEQVEGGREEAVDQQVLRLTIEELLERLDERSRRMLALHLSGMGVEEIAELVDRSPRTVYRTVTNFQEMLEPLLYDE